MDCFLNKLLLWAEQKHKMMKYKKRLGLIVVSLMVGGLVVV
jgi:hypothetical protein